MPDWIVLRLHPVEPVDGAAFAAYLRGLVIRVTDRSFAKPGGGTLVGTARWDANPSNTRIVQHESPAAASPGPPPPPVLAPAATAIVEVTTPSGSPEYLGPDLAVSVERSGKKIADRRLHYNVDVLKGLPLPPPLAPAYEALGPTAMYLALPDPKIGLDPNVAYVEVPADGTPPPFADLLAAMKQVLAKDPGGAIDPASLTKEQSRHVAGEIVHNRGLRPLPSPPPGMALEDLYTPGKADDARRRFESDLKTYYAIHAAETDVLAKYVFSVSAALAATKQSQDAERVGFKAPVLPGKTTKDEHVFETTVALTK